MQIEEFFDIGAALALQTRTTTTDGGEWASESAELLFCKVGSLPIFFLPSELSPREDSNPIDLKG